MSLDLHVRRPFDAVLLRRVRVLLGSKYHLTLLDNAQIWTAGKAGGRAMLNVIASDVATLMAHMTRQDSAAGKAVRRRTGRGAPVTIRLPDTYPVAATRALAAATRPWSALARVAAAVDGTLTSGFAARFPGRR